MNQDGGDTVLVLIVNVVSDVLQLMLNVVVEQIKLKYKNKTENKIQKGIS